MTTVWIVTNGTGGQVDSAWDSEAAADARAAALNCNPTEVLGWWVLALPVQQAVAA